MLPICVVNNYGQFNHLIHRALKDLDIEVALIPNSTPKEEVSSGYRGIILGGGPAIERAGRCVEYLDLGLPVLGICLGLHIIAKKFGGEVRKGKSGDMDRLKFLSVTMVISFQDTRKKFRFGPHMQMKSAGCRKNLRFLPVPVFVMWRL